MAPSFERLDLDNVLVQLLVTEAVKVDMDTPLRDSILDGVASATGERVAVTEGPSSDSSAGESVASEIGDSVASAADESPASTTETDTPEPQEKPLRTKLLQGGTVFVVMFVVLYVTLRRFTDDDSDG